MGEASLANAVPNTEGRHQLLDGTIIAPVHATEEHHAVSSAAEPVVVVISDAAGDVGAVLGTRLLVEHEQAYVPVAPQDPPKDLTGIVGLLVTGLDGFLAWSKQRDSL